MPSAPHSKQPTIRWAMLCVLLALIASLPLLRAGAACGHDILFHMGSWLDAAQQLRHGTLYPAWDFNAAWNAGEPRFTFYPPLSWMLGGLLTLLLPFRIVPATYTVLVLSSAALSLFFVARRYAEPHTAFLASALYVANPYLLFTAWERTAFAELLAAAWMPWLIAAALEDQPRIASLAWPLALLWLTNVPAGIMGCYVLALLGVLRIFRAKRTELTRILGRFVAAFALGVSLAAIYLVPAIYERAFVQVDSAFAPGLSVAANFLFAHTADAAHDFVDAQVSRITLALLAASAVLLFIAWRQKRSLPSPLLRAAAIFTAVIALAQLPLSLILWQHLPALHVLQFPWRFMTVLAPFACLAALPLCSRLPQRAAIPCAAIIVLALSLPLSQRYLHACPRGDQPADIAARFDTSHGVPSTDEYTPNNADNDFLRFDDPPYWLADSPGEFAPDTTPNPNATAPDTDFGDPDPAHTLSGSTPEQIQLALQRPRILVMNRRAYPDWRVTVNDVPAQLLRRDDGLIALALPAGISKINLRWHIGLDHWLGIALSLLALAVFARLHTDSRKIESDNHAR
ncbi:6-pyruvoyl-tetrahydropterin synthase-related protein [Granulicella cerasi]|uniref:6-pyruvoyl-tetrahydropterin synthase-related protein n=1 Tax=Granulicella cerasi TaxID=741063 RepID=UPI0021E00528|nr:6-pyruvoyl-tetrahydropterin synthase-related protein [Granulicella cerasi]